MAYIYRRWIAGAGNSDVYVGQSSGKASKLNVWNRRVTHVIGAFKANSYKRYAGLGGYTESGSEIDNLITQSGIGSLRFRAITDENGNDEDKYFNCTGIQNELENAGFSTGGNARRDRLDLAEIVYSVGASKLGITLRNKKAGQHSTWHFSPISSPWGKEVRRICGVTAGKRSDITARFGKAGVVSTQEVGTLRQYLDNPLSVPDAKESVQNFVDYCILRSLKSAQGFNIVKGIILGASNAKKELAAWLRNLQSKINNIKATDGSGQPAPFSAKIAGLRIISESLFDKIEKRAKTWESRLKKGDLRTSIGTFIAKQIKDAFKNTDHIFECEVTSIKYDRPSGYLSGKCADLYQSFDANATLTDESTEFRNSACLAVLWILVAGIASIKEHYENYPGFIVMKKVGDKYSENVGTYMGSSSYGRNLQNFLLSQSAEFPKGIKAAWDILYGIAIESYRSAMGMTFTRYVCDDGKYWVSPSAYPIRDFNPGIDKLKVTSETQPVSDQHPAIWFSDSATTAQWEKYDTYAYAVDGVSSAFAKSDRYFTGTGIGGGNFALIWNLIAG